MGEEYSLQTQLDFDKVRNKEIISKILGILKNENDELLAFHDIKRILKPKSRTYKGLLSVKIDNIVGSEGRYKDFNRLFLPKHQHLSERWKKVDLAHYKDLILPPIKLYEIGGVYFVGDGNHRVSVAKAKGQEFIDAEVISLNSEIQLNPDMTREELKKAVINFEKKRFFEATELNKLRPNCNLDFSSPGRFEEIIMHIEGHKYYINLNDDNEIPFKKAMLSWYDKVYEPIVKIMLEEHILERFPERTPGDLYVWIVKKWHELKEQYGENYSIKKAILDFSDQYGRGFFAKLKEIIKRIFKRLF